MWLSSCVSVIICCAWAPSLDLTSSDEALVNGVCGLQFVLCSAHKDSVPLTESCQSTLPYLQCVSDTASTAMPDAAVAREPVL